MAAQVRASLTFFDRQLASTCGVVTEFSVEHTEAQHDLVTLSVRGIPISALADRTDMPVRFDWTLPIGSETVYGYAKVLEPTGDRVTTGMAKLQILGATYPLRFSNNRTWNSAFYPLVARDVVSPYQLGVERDDDSVCARTVIQGERSDWQLLSDLADELGYSLTNDNTVIRFIDPYREFARLPRYSTQLVLTLPPTPANVRSFSVKMVSSDPQNPSQDWRLQVVGTGGAVVPFRSEWEAPSARVPVQGKRIGQPPPTKFKTGTYPSWAAARQFAQSEVRRTSWTHSMEATCVIDPRYKVGTLIYVVDRANQYTGHWFITSVHHRMAVVSSTDFSMSSKLSMKRSIHGPEKLFIGGRRPSPARPGTVLVNGRWRSARDWQLEG